MTAIRACTITLIATLLILIGGTVRAEEPELIQHGETEDVYQVTVSPNVEPFLFHVSYGDFAGSLVVSDIDIYRGDTLLQSLDVDMEEGFGGGSPFHTADLNNDGYDDIETLAWRGVTGNEGWSFWLYNPKNDRFEYFDVMCNPSYENDSTVTEWADGGAMGHIYRKKVYRCRGGKIVLIRDEKQDIDKETGELRRVIKELHDGEMVYVGYAVLEYDDETHECHEIVRELRGGKMEVVSDRILTFEEAYEW